MWKMMSRCPLKTCPGMHDDDFVSNWDWCVAILLKPQQDIQEALARVHRLAVAVAAMAAPVHDPLSFLNDLLQDVLYLLPAGERLARRRAEHPRELARREDVGHGEPCRLVQRGAEGVEELVAVLAPAADAAPHDDVVDELRDPAAQVHGLAGGGGRGEVPDQARHLLLADAPERPHPRGGQELQRAQLPELPPPLAVGREGHVVAAEGDHPDGGAEEAVGERDVLVPEDLLRRLRRRHDHGEHLAERYLHEVVAPVLLGERAHRPVDGVAPHEVVEAADHRQLPWPRRQVEPWLGGI
ncbi:Os10g0439862 [Oryza sativa Japonica Group]|uniref:Os10g0439862 protein n=1 Tax=Oryza sativa subsp. japonica TaxID=39947 RepID=A0A0P0XUM0_ORYSJ|nr:Os10g0439862 [Oryza sativa Japonica Group]